LTLSFFPYLAMASFEHLPRELLELVFAPLSGFAPALEFVCRAWRAFARADREPRPKVLSLAGIAGLGLLPLLVWAHESRPAGFGWQVAARILIAAAARGHEPVVRYLLDSTERFEGQGSGWPPLNEALVHAARGGHTAAAALLAQQGASNHGEAFVGAAEGGHEDLMRLVQSWRGGRWPPTAYNEAMICAAGHGSEACMRLAKEWGATYFGMAADRAAESGHDELARLAGRWLAERCAEVGWYGEVDLYGEDSEIGDTQGAEKAWDDRSDGDESAEDDEGGGTGSARPLGE
jgi:hypothetical protein